MSATIVDWHGQLVDQLDWHWRTHARPRLDGLGDEAARPRDRRAYSGCVRPATSAHHLAEVALLRDLYANR